MKQFYLLLKLFLVLSVQTSWAQVLNPNDPVVVYNASAPPTEPAWGQIGKWVKTTRVNWSTDSYKAYIYKGIQFRLKWPANYNPTKKYPIIVFFHGLGEKGTKFDNEYQLYHGGETAKNKVDNGSFDGFLLYPQNLSGYFGPAYYDGIEELINNFFRPELNVDPYRIIVHGLSAGGSATWDFMRTKPKLVAALAPISAATSDLSNSINSFKYTPIWWFQGGSDPNPPPQVATAVFNSAVAAGANIKLTVYPGQGHGVWNLAWGETDFFPFASRAYKSNPWPLFGRTEFCPNDPINITLGLTAGFNNYEWRKDGALIAGATSNTLAVTSYGTYSARIYNGTVWSDWSPAPVVIKQKAPTVSPIITTSGLMSNVLPTPAGSDSVVLEVPDGYATYLWKKATDATTLSTTRRVTVRQAGDYVVKISEQFGCSSDFSAPFKVIPANGTNAPDPINGLIATSTSRTQITLNWNDKPNPTNNETLFEVYRSLTAVGGYALVAKVNADLQTYLDNGLNAGVTYYYVIRPVNNNGAATTSAASHATTQVDSQAPSIPGNLTVTGISRNSVALSWTASTDDVGVDKYEVYINGIKAFTIAGNQTTFLAAGLNYQQSYAFVIKARDVAGNISNSSNQVSATTVASGLNYKFYTGTWSTLPNFATLTPVKTGNTPNIDLTVRTQNDNFAFLWEGYINIPVAGNYTFETNSDDGSKLYIGAYDNAATALVNNDGAHGAQYKEGTINLTAGAHPIAITFFEIGGGESMQVYWKNTAHGVVARQLIPSSYFAETPVLGGTAPAIPDSIVVKAATHNKLNITWKDNSNNESGFEIYRSATANGTYTIVATTGANKTSFADSALTPLTTYYYRVKAINQYGDSGFSLTDRDGLKYDYYEATSYNALPDFAALTPKKSGNVTTVDITPRDRNTQFAMKFEGWFYAPTAGSYTFYTSSDAGSKLFIDGFTTTEQVVSNDHTTGTVEKSGVRTLTAGYHKLIVTYYESTGSRVLTASYAGPGVTKRAIPAASLLNPYIKGTTLALPTTPAVPTGLTATAVSPSKINLRWNDNATTETSVDVYRSVNVNTNYVLFTTLPAVDSTIGIFTDSTVVANTVYFYKLKESNAGGTSVFSNEATTASGNTVPVVAALANKGMRFDTQLQVDVTATDADGDALTLTASNLPSFATFADNGNGTGRFTFVPSITTLGAFENITVTANDGHSGTAAQAFTITVDDNYQPVLSNISSVTLVEKATSNIQLTAADQNTTDVLTWTVTGLPEFATLTPNGSTAQIALAPGYADNGVYAVSVKITDGRGGEDIKNFNITVTDIDPNFKLQINFNEGSWQAVTTWNNLNKKPALGDVFPDLKDVQNRSTGLALNILTPWGNVNGGNNTNNFGYVTGNNTGIYPDLVMGSNWFTQTVKQSMKFTGADTNYLYSFTFFGSRNGISDNRITVFRLNDTATASLNASNNQNQTATISNIKANAAGEILFELDKGPGSDYGYMASAVITATYNDGKAPAKAGALKANIISSGVRLSWTDRAFNETAYKVYRSSTPVSGFQVLATLNANDTAYTDPNVVGNSTYYYNIEAINNVGSSFSDTISVTLPNRAPVLAAIADANIKTDSVLVINLTATDDAADVITFTATGLPSYATLLNNGNGTAKLTISPVEGNIGISNITVTATDNHSLQTSRTFKLQVVDKNINSIFVNFNGVGQSPAAAPWNNFNSAPNTGVNITNLKDIAGVSSGATITIVDQLTGENNLGAVTGNNTGVYPDDVMRTAFYDQTNVAKRIRISNLSSTLKYNLVFFGSRGLVSDNRNTTYAIGAQSVTLNAASNTANTVQINGVSPDASGNIEFTIKQAAGSSYAYLSALVIQSYVDNGTPLTPDNLATSAATKTAITLTWADKSSNETGFEVYRSTSRTGTYSLITTTAANVTTYTNTGLTGNTTYFYKVRAKANAVYSGYTSIVSGSTLAYSVYINFNTEQAGAGAPWNNTNSLPYLGQTMANPKDSDGNLTSFTWTTIEAFTGTNNAGKQTGNNSGVYPDAVMAESYYVESGDTARMLFSGMDQSKEYSFTFFGSRLSSGIRITYYTINGKSVTLDVYDNTTRTVTLEKIVPNENGEVILTMYAESVYGYLGALVVNAYPKENTGGAGLVARNSGGSQVSTDAVGFAKTDLTLKPSANSASIQNVYPNPFSTFFNLSMQIGDNSGKVVVQLMDISGRSVMVKDLGTLSAGYYQQRIEVRNDLAKGVYMLQITVDGKPAKSVKLIKN